MTYPKVTQLMRGEIPCGCRQVNSILGWAVPLCSVHRPSWAGQSLCALPIVHPGLGGACVLCPSSTLGWVVALCCVFSVPPPTPISLGLSPPSVPQEAPSGNSISQTPRPLQLRDVLDGWDPGEWRGEAWSVGSPPSLLCRGRHLTMKTQGLTCDLVALPVLAPPGPTVVMAPG